MYAEMENRNRRKIRTQIEDLPYTLYIFQLTLGCGARDMNTVLKGKMTFQSFEKPLTTSQIILISCV